MSRLDHFHVGASPVEHVVSAARRYAQTSGLHVPAREGYGSAVMPQAASRSIADAYDRMPEFSREAVPAYRQMAHETGRQFDFMTKPRSRGGMGIDVEVTKHDPYGQRDVHDIVGELRHDVVNKNRISVLSTAATGGHAVFSNDEKDMFRAVHDVFGHLGSGRGIDAHGEEAAFQKHSRMFSPLARSAMATETRGQNAALHKHGSFQEQKIGLLPEHMQGPQFTAQTGSIMDRLNAVREARFKNQQQGL